MSATAVLTARPHPEDALPRADEGLSLAALMDLLTVSAESGRSGPAAGGDFSVTALRLGLREWSSRAAAWGAGPEGVWRAW